MLSPVLMRLLSEQALKASNQLFPHSSLTREPGQSSHHRDCSPGMWARCAANGRPTIWQAHAACPAAPVKSPPWGGDRRSSRGGGAAISGGSVPRIRACRHCSLAAVAAYSASSGCSAGGGAACMRRSHDLAHASSSHMSASPFAPSRAGCPYCFQLCARAQQGSRHCRQALLPCGGPLGSWHAWVLRLGQQRTL